TLAGMAPSGMAAELADYTAFPPFLPEIVPPNILFLLDYSQSMVRPAYGDCNEKFGDCRTTFFQPGDDFDPTTPYDGYFDPRSRYDCSGG
ncbi:MAG: hypothetical protein GWN87_32045, partial [Desulfuromonadales bacterium]|nr:hypothetical protein [Desulfuromonadales bacterium]NIS44147.1 hypothetical protein [Desulfuromonadales bacterium]